MAISNDIPFKIGVEGMNEFLGSLDRAKRASTGMSREANRELTKTDHIINDLEKEYRELTAARNKATTTAEIKKFNAAIGRTRENLRVARASMQKTGKSAGGLGNILSTIGPQIGAAFAVSRIVDFGTASVEVFREFESAAQSLSAITGLTGEGIEALKDRAEEMGIAAGIAGAQVLKAFELVGSAKPELLSSADALADVTQEAILLSQASGLELPTAIDSLANTLNQFGKGAGEAHSVVDQLAAASQAGAEAIPGLAQALRVAGSTAAASNVPLNEALAAIELISETGVKSAEAGTEFRNFLTIAQKEGIGFVDGVFSMTAAVQELNERNLNFSETEEIFGRAATRMAIAAASGEERFLELASAIGKSGVAQEQAAANTDTLEFAQKRLSASVDALMKNVGEALTPAIRGLAEFITEALNRSDELTEGFRDVAKIGGLLGEQIASLAEKFGLANTEIDSVSLSFDLVTKTAKGFLNPLGLMNDAIQFVTDKLENLTENALRKLGASEGFIDGVSDAFDVLKTVIETMLNPLGSLIDGLEYIGVLERDAVSVSDQLAKSLSGNVDAFNRYSREINAFANVTGASAEELEKFLSSADRGVASFTDFAAKISRGGLTVAEQQAVFNQMADLFKRWKSNAEGAASATGDLERASKSLGGEGGLAPPQIQPPVVPVPDVTEYNEAINALTNAEIEREQAMQAAKTEVQKLESETRITNALNEADRRFEAMEKIRAGIEKQRKAWIDLGKAIQGSAVDAMAQFAFNLGQAAGGAVTFQEAFKQLGQALLVEIPRMAGMALINMALTAQPWPLAAAMLIGGLALVGSSGLASGILNQSNAAPATEMPSGPGTQQASPAGLSRFEGGGMIENTVIVSIDGQELSSTISERKERRNRRRGM